MNKNSHMKLLLVGELNETLNSLNEYLSEDFDIQMCSENAKIVKDMIKLIRPTIIVFNFSDISLEIEEIFKIISVKLSNMPLVAIGTKPMQELLELQLEGFKNSKVLFRPLKTSEVLEACYEVLKMELPDEKNVDEAYSKPSKKRILVVDDAALILRRIKQMLEPEYQVILANSGEKALNVLSQNDIDFVLLDYDMPGMDGREVFEEILAKEETQNIPVVFLTSIAERKRIIDVLKRKPFGYILKPPASDKIKSIIEEALKK